MATFLLDTSVIIDALNDKRDRNQFLADMVKKQGHSLACCPFNVTEIYTGLRPKEEQRTTELLRSLRFTQSPSRSPNWPAI